MAAAKRSRDKDVSELALFLDMLIAERGAAAHTIEAYTRDLSEFLAFLAAKGKTAKTASRDHLRAFLAGLARKGLAPTSRARKLSAIRQFFRFLLAEGIRGDDPCSAIDSPKLGRPLPKILSLAEVETLLETAKQASERAADGTAKRRALRLYAALETLYATGLRVSELIALPRDVLIADDRVLTIKGKGGRERLVPLNEAAREALQAHLDAVERGRGQGEGRLALAVPVSRGPASHPPALRPGAEGAGLGRRASSPPASRRMCCVTPLPAICWSGAPICARCSSCSAMPTSRPRRSTPMSSRSGCGGWSSSIIRWLRLI